jgi:hypothetical protein
LGGQKDGPNIPLSLATPATVTFLYDPVTHQISLEYANTGICATAFYDANVNGYNDENLPLPGVTFNLSGGSTAAQVSGSNGKACFENLAPGTYTVTATQPSGSIATTATAQTINLQQPQIFSSGQVCLGDGGAKPVSFWMGKKGKLVFDNAWNKDYLLYSFSPFYPCAIQTVAFLHRQPLKNCRTGCSTPMPRT